MPDFSSQLRDALKAGKHVVVVFAEGCRRLVHSLHNTQAEALEAHRYVDSHYAYVESPRL